MIETLFPIVRATGQVPLDHGFALYGAVARTLGPGVHGAGWLAIHPLGGIPVGSELHLARRPQLRLRLPTERLAEVLSLAGKVLRVQGAELMLGAPSVRPLEPHRSLDARIVFIKLTDPKRDRRALDPAGIRAGYLAELRRQLDRLGLTDAKPSLKGRRTLRVHGRTLQGFSVRVENLSDPGSLQLQAHGLGGKRAMGCGIFRPTRGAAE